MLLLVLLLLEWVHLFAVDVADAVLDRSVVVADFVAVNAFVVAIVVVQALVCKCDR